MADQAVAPILATQQQKSPMALLGGTSPALQIILDDRLYERCKDVAKTMAAAEGITPTHLFRKPEACFAIVQIAIIWKLSPHMVAQCTYQTPGGKIGYEGKLCQAIIENSGRVEGTPTPEYFGDWDKVLAKFTIETSAKGGKYPKPAWKPADEEGLGVIVRAQVIGEKKPREFEFLLKQAFPRNSTLWATDPKTQLWYSAVRRFGNVATPGIFMGVPFDREDVDVGGGPVIDHIPSEEVGVETKARPAKSTVRKAKQGAKEMDEEFKDAVAQATPAQETVIEDVDQETGEVTEQDNAPEPEQDKEDEVATEEPEREEEKPAQQAAAPAPAQEKAPEPAAAKADLPPAMTELEAKAFRNRVEKDVLNFKGSLIEFQTYKDMIMADYKRLKAAFPDQAEKLSKMIGGKTKFLKDREAENDMD